MPAATGNVRLAVFESAADMIVENLGRVIELGRLIYRSRDDRADSWFRMAQLLLDAFRNHAVEGDAGEYEKFRSDLKELQDRLNRSTAAAEVLVLAGSAVKQVEDYNRAATQFLTAKSSQLQQMVSMLARAVGETASLDRASMARLKRLERRMEKASAIEDVLAVKAHLAECLSNVRMESRLRATQIERLANSLEQTRDHLPESPDGEFEIPDAAEEVEFEGEPDFPPDILTGLPQRRSALQCLSRAIAAGRPQFVVASRVKQLAAVNSRYGRETGDALLLAVCNRLRSIIGAEDSLFRWTGNSFVAALERTGDPNSAMMDVHRAIPRHAKESFPFRSRSIILTLGIASTAFRIADYPAHKDLEEAIDRCLGIDTAISWDGFD